MSSPTGTAFPAPGMAAYGVAKGALVVLTRYMAREWGEWNIRANAIAPGLIVDDRHVTADAIASNPVYRALLDRTSLRRPGVPADLAGVVAFLASDAARFVSGALIPVDGCRF
ncbi:SDR family oxidoreductase [Amycolatopsis alkalitolerans]|uniref:SDR family oxidoreductase n=1 Tax=Amycolatopsis alkalitolerans TaxID=2547244 RepID=A0A5C4M8P8_9PSEU|nr:SDR family oxidoreductase [Amycolatopsis alkalitolerans]